MKLLHIDSSITGTNSASRQLSAALVAGLKAAIPGLEVIRRDLDAYPIPHLDSKRLPTVRPANAPQSAVGIADEGGDDVLDEFLSADILVIGAPTAAGMVACAVFSAASRCAGLSASPSARMISMSRIPRKAKTARRYFS